MISRRSFLDGLFAIGAAAALVGVAASGAAAAPEAAAGARELIAPPGSRTSSRNHRRAHPNTFWSRRARRRAKKAHLRRAEPKQ